VGTVGEMNNHGTLMCSIHGDATEFANGREQDDVCYGTGIKSDGPDYGKIAYEGRVLMSAVGQGPKGVDTAAHIGKHGRVSLNRNCRLGVEENAVRAERGRGGLSEDEL
jgi:hypothetical protein